MNDSGDNKWFSQFLGKCALFLDLFSLILIFYYLLGNFQGFLDSTQKFLLSVLETVSLAGILVHAYMGIILVVRAINKKGMEKKRFISILVFLCYFLIIYIVIKFFTAWI
jgi:ABC-type transport system involved in multi-copper enzyme maturation permease subunit